MPHARLTRIDLPIFPRSEVAPELPASVYPARVERLRERAAERGCDSLGGPYFTTNTEDGIALADAPLRRTLAAILPDLWERVRRRRAFMRDVLGIDLHPDVLPLSNIPAVLPPFLLRPDRVMALDS